jgi:DNA-binding CsgD family transcriptional regulator
LARAEAKLGDSPEAAELVRQARSEATEVITELRDLSRGIAPPVLADRGLAEAARSLGGRTPAGVTVRSNLESRPLPVVETAADFVIAESPTNAAKYAPESPVEVTLFTDGGTALDREVVAELVKSRGSDDSLGELTPRETEVLLLMAEGRTNSGIADALVVTPGAVEKHISSIFSKLDLSANDADHRRVLAVLTFLQAAG